MLQYDVFTDLTKLLVINYTVLFFSVCFLSVSFGRQCLMINSWHEDTQKGRDACWHVSVETGLSVHSSAGCFSISQSAAQVYRDFSWYTLTPELGLQQTKRSMLEAQLGWCIAPVSGFKVPLGSDKKHIFLIQLSCLCVGATDSKLSPLVYYKLQFVFLFSVSFTLLLSLSDYIINALKIYVFHWVSL